MPRRSSANAVGSPKPQGDGKDEPTTPELLAQCALSPNLFLVVGISGEL